MLYVVILKLQYTAHIYNAFIVAGCDQNGHHQLLRNIPGTPRYNSGRGCEESWHVSTEESGQKREKEATGLSLLKCPNTLNQNGWETPGDPPLPKSVGLKHTPLILGRVCGAWYVILEALCWNCPDITVCKCSWEKRERRVVKEGYAASGHRVSYAKWRAVRVWRVKRRIL